MRSQNVIPSLFLDFMQMQQFAKNPLVFAEGKGIHLTDSEGKRYIDGLSGVFVTSLGHGNQPVIEAMSEQLKRLAFAPPLHSTTAPALELTQLLLQVAPPGVSALKFLSGGSEATEAAMKLTRQYHQQSGNPRKYKIIGRYGAYHGGTMGALSAGGGRERKSIYEPLGVGFIHVHPPYCYRCPFDQSYPTCGRTCVGLIEKTIEAEDPATVAAVIVEPISISSAGFMVPPPDYLPRLREICDKHNVVLIYDEIITGFGRLGTMFGSEYFKAPPDITCCGKGMSGGYAPLAAILIRDRIAASFYGEDEENVQFHHGHTYAGNPVACAAGVAAMTQLIEGKLVDNAHKQGERLRQRLLEIAERHKIIGDVRGAGLLQGVEFTKDRGTKERFPAKVRPGKVVEREARARGLLLRCGNDFAAFAPPLIVTPEQIDEMTGILGECIAVAERELGAVTAADRLAASPTEGRLTPEMLRLAVELADDARAFVRPRFRSRVSIEEKSDGTPVTEVDTALEARLRDRIHARFREHGIIGEEGGGQRGDADWVWVLDPIDGTQSFILGKPTFATLIGLMHRGRPVLGVIEHPALGDRWVGAAGTPTLFNDAPARVRPCAGVAEAALSTTGPNWFAEDELAGFDRVRRVAKVQHWGGDCHAFGLLASGFIDLVIESSHRLHDFCALVPVIEGAGGVMTDWAGRALGAASGPRVIAAGDRRVHAEALALLGEGKSW